MKCPIDDYELLKKNDGIKNNVYYLCPECGAPFENLENLEEQAVRYLEVLNQWNDADKKRIELRERIIYLGIEKKLI